MVNIDALVAALPHTTLEPPTVVRAKGLTQSLITDAFNLGVEVVCRGANGWISDTKSLVAKGHNTHAHG